MIDIIINPIKKRQKTERIDKEGRMIKTFRAERDILHYLRGVGNTTKFIHKALRFYIKLLSTPTMALRELKKIYPMEWKYINRRRL